MEESHHVVVRHEPWLFIRTLGEVGDHASNWIIAPPVLGFISRNQAPDSRVAVLILPREEIQM